MNDGRRALIHLLDGRKLEIIIQSRLFIDELLNIVASHISLKDSDKKYFALAYVDRIYQYQWLPNKGRVLEFDILRKMSNGTDPLELHHCVKFFVDSYAVLQHASTVELYFLDIKSRFLRGLLDLDDVGYCKIVSYLLQIYDGNYSNDNRTRLILSNLLPLPRRLLISSDLTYDEFENKIINSYKKLNTFPQGSAILSFLQIAQRSPTYGSHFYEVLDKSGSLWILAVNCKGIFQYNPNSVSEPKRVFPWRSLDNLYYKDRKFSIEVRNSQSNIKTSNYLLYHNNYNDNRYGNIRESFDTVNKTLTESTAALGAERPYQTSLSIYAYFCENALLCKIIWLTAIELHQFYLDQRTNARYNEISQGSLIKSSSSYFDVNDLSEQLNNIVIRSSVTSSLPSLSSISSLNIGMPAAKVVDSSSISIPSLDIVCIQKTEEEKQRDLELCKELNKKKEILEEKLLEKLDQLREICIQEAEITGEIPKDIYKTLLPGEEEPKVKRRIGTAFTLSDELLNRTNDGNDRISEMETGVELNRKIVAAAERLAKDKSANKSVRRKRRKDLVAATQRLRGLEKGLHQMRLSASKPDVSERICQSGQNWTGAPSRTINSLIAKSCPTTPRGSIPDLCASSSNEDGRATTESGDSERRRNGYNKHASSATQELHHIVPLRKPSVPSSKIIVSMEPRANGVIRPHIPSYVATNDLHSNLPVHENVGYRSSASYKSSYRQSNYPTLNDPTPSVGHVQRTYSDYSIHDQKNLIGVIDCEAVWRDKSVDQIDEVDGYHRNVNDNFGTTFGNEEASSASSASHTKQGCYDFCTNPAATSSVVKWNSSNGWAEKFASKQLRHAIMPTSRSYNSNFITGSLDRRSVKNKQIALGTLDIKQFGRVVVPDHQTSEKMFYPIISKAEHNATSTLLTRLSSQNTTTQSCTTFPVSNGGVPANGEMCKATDVRYAHRLRATRLHQYSSNSINSFLPMQSSSSLINSPPSSFRPPPPSYPIAVRSAINVTYNGSLTRNLSSSNTPCPPNTEAHRNMKNATIV